MNFTWCALGKPLENYEQEGGRLECAPEGCEEGEGHRGGAFLTGWAGGGVGGCHRYQQAAILQEAVGSGIRWSVFTSWLFIS